MTLLRAALSLFRRPGQQAVAVAPAEWRSRGNAALSADRLDEAADYYQKAAVDPSDAVARLNLGFALLEKKDTAGAMHNLSRALVLRQPHQEILHEIHYLLGRAYRQQGDTARATASFEEAVEAAPSFAEPMKELSELLRDADCHEESLRWTRRLNDTRPSIEAEIAVAHALFNPRRYPEAQSALDDILRREPNNPEAWTGLGQVLGAIKQPQKALEAVERALAILGPSPDSLSSAGHYLLRCGRGEEALERFAAATRLNPDHRPASGLLRIDEVIEMARRGLAKYPDDAELHWAQANAYLLAGRLKEGWVEHEWRWKAESTQMRDPMAHTGKRWTGADDLRGKTILLFPEQGLGDSIQMLRYVPLVAEQGAHVLLQLPKPLNGLQLTKDIEAHCTLLRPEGASAIFDLDCPLLSLPLAVGSDEASLPRTVPYLRSAPEKAERWRARLAQAGPGLKVGVAWSGSAAHANDRNRSIALETFRSIHSPGCLFVSLQPDVRDSDRAAIQDWPELLPWGEELSNFDETAALMAALDLVVCVDTSVAHLAGALARPVIVLLPYRPDWRWMLHRLDSPWYPTAQLYRQEKAGDWNPVLQRVREELSQRAATRERADSLTLAL